VTEFLAMGGYAVYVWGAYAVAAVLLIANALAPVLTHRRLLRHLGRRGTPGRAPVRPAATNRSGP
jgi:heme exporter protein D